MELVSELLPDVLRVVDVIDDGVERCEECGCCCCRRPLFNCILITHFTIVCNPSIQITMSLLLLRRPELLHNSSTILQLSSSSKLLSISTIPSLMMTVRFSGEREGEEDDGKKHFHLLRRRCCRCIYTVGTADEEAICTTLDTRI